MGDFTKEDIQDEINEIDKQIGILKNAVAQTKDKSEAKKFNDKMKELSGEKEEYARMLAEMPKDEDPEEENPQAPEPEQKAENYKGYFRSDSKMFACVLKPADVMYDDRGHKIVKKKALVVEFMNFRYVPKTEEEKKLLFAFSEKHSGLVKYISATAQIKRDELDKQKAKLEKELNDKYSDVEQKETASMKRGLA